MLSRAILAGSSFARVGSVAPCNVAFGRQPSTLPLLEADEGGEGNCVAGARAVAGGEVQPRRL
eukprot:8002023-Pyramimonas_sp.AAC.1